MKKSNVFLLLLLISLHVNSQALEEVDSLKSGWIIYYNEHAVWFEGDNMKSGGERQFFLKGKYPNGLIIDYLPQAELYKEAAKKFTIKVLFHDTINNTTGYTLKDSLLILPAKAKVINSTKPVSETLTPMGLSFKQKEDEVTLQYNFETNYDVS